MGDNKLTPSPVRHLGTSLPQHLVTPVEMVRRPNRPGDPHQQQKPKSTQTSAKPSEKR